MINIGYFRVSKEDETLQDLDSQVEVIRDKFNIEFNKIFKERKSAYKVEKLKDRSEFLQMIDFIFKARQNNINSLFYGTFLHHDEEINLYIWDYHRIMRNIEFSLLFQILCDLFKINIYSYKQGIMKLKDEDSTPAQKLVRYLLFSTYAFSGEDYSYHTSQNIKKAIKRDGSITKSRDGNKWGRALRRIDGSVMPIDEVEQMRDRIIKLIKYYTNKGLTQFYSKIIRIIKKEFNIILSRSYISRIKNVRIE